MLSLTASEKGWQCVCGNVPCDGLDCGVWLPGQAPRKKQDITFDQLSAIRKRAWQMRRDKYHA